ncbi:hypothetical protein HDU97_009128 [Phlyctochytrium planicorne]|nr:hypothetical protein HDU97_009128 [Phlyctochytrium planicorne]
MFANPLPPPIAEPVGLDTGVHLLWGSGSPPAQRVQIALYEKGIPFSGHMVSFANRDTRRAAWIRRLNPRCQVPTLVDNGFSIAQSISILLYLEEKYPEKPLMATGEEFKARTITRMLDSEEYIREQLQEAFQIVNGIKTDQESKDTLFKDLTEELDLWEDHLASNAEKFSGGWLAGPSFSLAEAAIFPTMMVLVERLGLSFGKRERLTAWYKQNIVRESIQKSTPPHWATTPVKIRLFEGVEI